MYTLNCRGKLLSLEKPVVMGIINATPDSFYKSDLKVGFEGIIQKVAQMIHDGAAIIDVGGQSTKPGSELISSNEEMDRVIPVISGIKKSFPDVLISVDTFYSEVAESAITAGASIVNDVSGGSIDPAILSVAGKNNVPYICMHMKGTPQNMQQHVQYDDLIKEMIEYYQERISQCKAAGIKDIIIDPGFGFSKTVEQNYFLLRNLSVLGIFTLPLLAGLSRKSMIYKYLNTVPEESLNGTTVLNTLALTNGASILRVHDVKAAQETIALYEMYKKASV